MEGGQGRGLNRVRKQGCWALPLACCILGKAQSILEQLMNSIKALLGAGSRYSINPFPATGGAREPQFISQDWPGVPGQVDAAMAGHIYISGSALHLSSAKKPKSKRRNRKRYRSRRGRGRSKNPGRQSRSALLSWFSSEEGGLGTYSDSYQLDWLVPATCEPIQSVYFFSGGGGPWSPCSWSSWGSLLLSLLPTG